MNEAQLANAIKQCRTDAKQRKFRQSVELFINFKGIDFAKAENRVDVNVSMPFATGKTETRVLVFAKDKEFITQLQGKVSKIITESEIASLDKKAAAQLATDYDLLLAEGPVMLTVGKYLGPALAPKGKLPQPILANVAAVENALKKVKGSVRITNKKGKFNSMVHALIGHEKMNDDELAKNAFAVYSSVLNTLPGKQQNIKSLVIKLTMGKPVKVRDEVKP